MENSVLTDDGNRVLRKLYKEYKNRRKKKQPEGDARYFGDEEEVQHLLFPDDLAEEIGNICWYLHNKGLLYVFPGDDKANDIEFTDDGIAYMENRLSRALEKCIDVFSKLKP